jgi:hypothetical protein
MSASRLRLLAAALALAVLVISAVAAIVSVIGLIAASSLSKAVLLSHAKPSAPAAETKALKFPNCC